MYGIVNWNNSHTPRRVEYAASLPTWERELKRAASYPAKNYARLLPTWERELKPSLLKCFTAAIYYRSLYGSVSWNYKVGDIAKHVLKRIINAKFLRVLLWLFMREYVLK